MKKFEMEKEKWMAKEGREPGKGDNMVHATCYGEQRTGPGAENKYVEEGGGESESGGERIQRFIWKREVSSLT